MNGLESPPEGVECLLKVNPFFSGVGQLIASIIWYPIACRSVFVILFTNHERVFWDN
jgi:hypothetical protein